MTDEDREALLIDIRDLLKGRSAYEQAVTELSGPAWCHVTLDVAAHAIGYAGSARPRENSKRWLIAHHVPLLRLGQSWVCTVGDLRRVLEKEAARQKELDAQVRA